MNTERVGSVTGKFMIAIAVLVDITQFLLVLIPFVGWLLGMVLSIVASFLFGIWFSHHGVSLMSSKRVLGFLGTMVGEWIPFISAAPFWTCLVAFTVIQEWRLPKGI